MAEIDLFADITDEELREIQAAWDAKLLKLKHPYVFDLIKILAPYPRGLRRAIALDWLYKNRERAGLNIPPSFDNSVQSAMQYYCRDSDEFKKRGAPERDALFCWPKGKGKGIWLLLHANARTWVQQNRGAIPRRALGR